MKSSSFDIKQPRRQERAVLVGHAGRDKEHLDRSLDELALLADTAGAKVLDRLVQRRSDISASTFIGKGKVEELKALCESVEADMAIFDDDLSPAQGRNLEKALDVKVIDRSELILDIFARRARTRESRLQVELAQLEYTLPRLMGMWKHLERQAGGIGSRGPGETQLETDRRLIRDRIARLKESLRAVERERETQRTRRRREFRVALVGYTNAGKSSLFNMLAKGDAFVENRLFATLDSTTRQIVSPLRDRVLVTDTVGFIRKLPHHLVASFHSTLIEAVEADLLLHVTDSADPDHHRHLIAVDDVLDKILGEPRSPRRMVFNKADLLSDDQILALRAEFPDAVVVSATTGDGVEALRNELFRLSADRREQRAG